jgi:putative Mn2+ efflux pump MntP
MIIGIFLVLIGALWTLNNLGIIHGNVAEYFWPIILIAIGIQIIWHRKDHPFRHHSNKDKE